MYEEGIIATSPVTVEVVSASVDSAGVQVEYLVDEGSTWQQYDYGMPLQFSQSGEYFVWFREVGGRPFNFMPLYSLATSYANKINLYNTYLNSLYLKFL